MSQPPYPPPSPGEPGPEGGYQPPAAPGSYPAQPSYPPPADQGAYPPPPGQGSYPPPGQPSYPPPPGEQGAYPPPGEQGAYPPPGEQGAYPPPGDQGAYPPPGGGVPQYGMAPPPKKKSSALKIVLIVVGVIALLCVGGSVAVFFAAKDKITEVVDASKITVVEPETLGGRPKTTNPGLQDSVEGLDGQMAQIPGATGSVGAVYGDPVEQDLVMVAAASSINGSAQSRFDDFTSGLSAGGINIDTMTDTDPGPLGGIAKCGDSDTAGVPMAVCVWSDNGSVGMITMMFKKKADLEKEFVAMRGEIEQKS
ncbi:hypothetical protein [Actinoplanes sp. NPDC049118]|uniref:DUF3824 domain-containing protein n=1 Tax=Actinoplanes sp. NPDC049118 TaxID=3155769 RepID=UPI00340EF714